MQTQQPGAQVPGRLRWQPRRCQWSPPSPPVSDVRSPGNGRPYRLEQLTGGCHVRVEIESEEEGVAILDRIRIWLPVLLAISTNWPYWHGVDSIYASYRWQAWSG